jgi:predicted thioesterase
LEPGLWGEADLVVGDADTACAMASGDVPVLATPRVVALCEAACAALVGHLRSG